jgi:NitT/TauT family transport system ATP-binding protein
LAGALDRHRARPVAPPDRLDATVRVIVDGVSKAYADRRDHAVEALRAVSFAVEAEEFVAVLGPSGCGKSTLLQIVAGLVRPTAGRVWFEGSPGERPLTAMVFQEFALFPWRTVQGNVEFGLEERGVAAGERRRRARAFLDVTGLGPFAEKYPHQLSGGMRQRVGIARALAVDPAVLLMDEPFSALDAQTRQLMQEELLALWERTRQSILYVTHNIHEAVWMADRILVLSRRPGQLIAEVPIDLPRPRDGATPARPAFAAAADRIWALVKNEARAALEEATA